MIDRCPQCSGSLLARKRSYYSDVALAEDLSRILSARLRADLGDDRWQIVCERGHDVATIGTISVPEAEVRKE